ncbi:hypothetical protein [uncultured Methanobrevibacter sp.]|uniref:hypothetical protein n=1 Tax=uncultured Methanobrevibacter sp. TaxID=253161 RepID=UPI0025EA7396|nr:hypothetical protein [uncultured Methanobrevibacter sp.]
MDIQIDRLYELNDDLSEVLIGDRFFPPNYNEVYPTKRVIKGVEKEVFMLRSKTFYEVHASHIPINYMQMDLSPYLLSSGVIANFNNKTKVIYLYNCTHNFIYIEKDCVIGEAYD